MAFPSSIAAAARALGRQRRAWRLLAPSSSSLPSFSNRLVVLHRGLASASTGGKDAAGVVVERTTTTTAKTTTAASAAKAAAEKPVKKEACGEVEEEEEEMEEMFVMGPAGMEWNGPTRGGRQKEPTRYGDWERKGRCTDFS